jgi:tRNA pseudouridine38-40 synthase
MGGHTQSLVNWKITLCYDGTLYHGWQVQPDRVTIQGELAAAIERVTRQSVAGECGAERVLPQGSGRTDAGVHALGQVASFRLDVPIPAENLLRALNRTLPASIRILSAEIIDADFHARHSATGKTYEYRIFRGEICSPFLAPYIYPLNWPLDLSAMHEAALLVRGTHDFTSFAAVDPDATKRQNSEASSNVRTVFESGWTEDAEMLTYRIRGSGFLHHMVRNLVGTFLEVGRGRILPAEISEILAARSRSAAGPTAPARGLFLVSVDY